MNYQQRQQLKKEVLAAYKQLMIPLYIGWRGIAKQEELRQQVVRIIVNHVIDRSIEYCHRRIRPATKTKTADAQATAAAFEEMFESIPVTKRQRL